MEEKLDTLMEQLLLVLHSMSFYSTPFGVKDGYFRVLQSQLLANVIYHKIELQFYRTKQLSELLFKNKHISNLIGNRNKVEL